MVDCGLFINLFHILPVYTCLLYTSDAADEDSPV